MSEHWKHKLRFPTPPPPRWHSERVRPVEDERVVIEAERPDYWVVARYAGRYSYLLGAGSRWLSRVGDGVWLFDSETQAQAAADVKEVYPDEKIRVRRWIGRPKPGMVFMSNETDEEDF